MNANFTGFVLAGGKSSRMKTDKAFLKFDGEAFLERAFNALAPNCGEVKIVINKNQDEKFKRHFPALDFVFDQFPERGAPGGIQAALKNSNKDWAIILACDLPLVSAEVIKTLTQIVSNTPENIAAVVPRQFDGRFQPLCAAYRVKMCLPKIEELMQNETFPSMKDFLKLIPVRFVEQRELTDGETPDIFFNVNRPADFRLLG